MDTPLASDSVGVMGQFLSLKCFIDSFSGVGSEGMGVVSALLNATVLKVTLQFNIELFKTVSSDE